MILGIDEVGRGSWAGPLVVGAVVLGGARIDGLTDSKKITKKQRERLDKTIREKAKSIGLSWVNAEKIDEIGLSQALKLATRAAVSQISVPYTEIIIDGTVNFLEGTDKASQVTTLKKADLLVPCVSAASIVAKVARDRFMAELDKQYSGYDFKHHVGYGTRGHQHAIENLGPTKVHRFSFRPLKKLTTNRSTKQIGDIAEEKAAEFLKKRNHKIIDRNWRTKYCEIDIISQKSGTYYFTEVKYRKNPEQGGGLGAITPKKLRQMKFAAEFYALANKISDTNLRLAVISLSGQPPIVTEFLENCS